MPSRTSLLAQDDNDPALSGPPNSVVEEESALSRLIAESTPPTALMPFHAALDETTQSSSLTNMGHQKASFTTILAGTLIVLQWGFVWGAYFSKSWMDIHLEILIGWQQKYLPWLNHHTDIVLQEISVFTLSDNLKEDKEYASLAGLWFCSVVLPCIFMIVCPIWILTDYSVPPKRETFSLGQPWSRLWLELTIRLSLLAVIIHTGLNVAISGIELHWEDTDLQVHNAFKGPFLSYLLGCTFALAAVVVLRMPYLEHLKLLSYPGQKGKRNPRLVAASMPEPTPPQALRAPPANAFRLPWLNSTTDGAEEDAAELEQPLLENGPPPTTPRQRQHHLSTWKNFLLFQVGVMSLILWFPAVALPQFRVLYSGLVMEMIKVPAYNVYVWQLPHIVWRSGTQADTPVWILILVGILVATLTVILPIMAHVVAGMAWLRGRGKWRDWLVLLHPTLCGIPFAAGLIVTVPAFIDIGENIDDDICVQIEHVIEDQCLISGGVVQWGAYFLLAQAVSLEAFVFLTLWWTAPPRPSTITV